MQELEKIVGKDPKIAAICIIAGVAFSLCQSMMENHYKGKIKFGSFIDIELEPVS